MTLVEGASRQQEALLREILAGMRGSRLTVVAVTDPDPTWQGLDPQGVALAVDYLEADRRRGHWDAMLLAGAFRDLSDARALPPVAALIYRDGAQNIGVSGRPLALEPPHERDGIALGELVRKRRRRRTGGPPDRPAVRLRGRRQATSEGAARVPPLYRRPVSPRERPLRLAVGGVARRNSRRRGAADLVHRVLAPPQQRIRWYAARLQVLRPASDTDAIAGEPPPCPMFGEPLG